MDPGTSSHQGSVRFLLDSGDFRCHPGAWPLMQVVKGCRLPDHGQSTSAAVPTSDRRLLCLTWSRFENVQRLRWSPGFKSPRRPLNAEFGSRGGFRRGVRGSKGRRPQTGDDRALLRVPSSATGEVNKVAFACTSVRLALGANGGLGQKSD